MPFDDLSDLESREDYIAILKDELIGLRNSGDAADYYFVDKFRFDGKNADPILVVGDISSKFLSQLKQLPGDYAQGHCNIKGNELRMFPKRGRAPESKVKNALRGTPFKPELVTNKTGIADEEEQSHRLATERMLKEAQEQFRKVAKYIPPGDRQKLKAMFGKYEKIFKMKDYAGAQQQLSQMGDRMANMLKFALRESRAKMKQREREQKLIHKNLDEIGKAMEKLDKVVRTQKAQVEKLRDGLGKIEPRKMSADVVVTVRDKMDEFEKAQKKMREQLTKIERKLDSDFRRIKAKKMQDPASQALATMLLSQTGHVNALQDVLDKTPMAEVQKMLAKGVQALKAAVR